MNVNIILNYIFIDKKLHKVYLSIKNKNNNLLCLFISKK